MIIHQITGLKNSQMRVTAGPGRGEKRNLREEVDKDVGHRVGRVASGTAVDDSNNAYITGHTSGNLDGATNAGGNDGFIVKHDTSGTLQ